MKQDLYAVLYSHTGKIFVVLVYTVPAFSAEKAIDLVQPRFKQDVKELSLPTDGFSIQTSVIDTMRAYRICEAHSIAI